MKVLPLYLPHQGCNRICAYCNQPLVIGVTADQNDWQSRLELLTTYEAKEEWEIAFYGGTFTALPRPEMDQYMQIISPYLSLPLVRGIRLSTRPDCVPDEILSYLWEKKVRTIELGVESLDDAVLLACRRSHNAETVRDAAARILHYGFQLGFHLMCGLPEQDETSWQATVLEAVELRPSFVRIAPTLVLHKTRLERWYREGRYQPLSLEEAVRQCGYAVRIFQKHHIPIARIGLALSDSQGEGSEKVAAGPWHPSLRHEVESSLAGETISAWLEEQIPDYITIHPRDYSIVIGPKKRNLARWELRAKRVIPLVRSENLSRYSFQFNHQNAVPLFYKDE